MAPDSGREYTVSCALKKAVLDNDHIARIKDAVYRVHAATTLATELLNLYVRDRIENHDATGLDSIFDRNWLLKAYQTVTSDSNSKRKPSIDPSVRQVFYQHMAGTITDLPYRNGLTQAHGFECRNLAAVGSNNVWMHFRKRVLAHVRTRLAIYEEEYEALSKEQRRQRHLSLLQVADDLCRNPADPMRCPEEYRAFVDEERERLGIDAAVGNWGGKSLLYHLKARPHRFLRAMHIMSVERAELGRSAFSLFPLRRSRVPGHMRFDQRVLDNLLGLGYGAEKQRAKKKAGPDLNAAAAPSGRKRKSYDPGLIEEKAVVFGQVVDLRAAGVHRRSHFAFAFTTDGVSIHLNMEKPSRDKAARLAAMPSRGIHSIDALKQFARSEEVHAVGIDPGKRELVVAVDRDDPKGAPVVRYTLDQRRRDMRTRQYLDEGRREKPIAVADAEEALSLMNSKAPSLSEFAAFAARRRELWRETPEWAEFYAQEEHRERRRKSKLKANASEARLMNRLKGMHSSRDTRPLVLAYGAWGLVAGRAGTAANKGNPPAVGAGLMKKLSVEFLVVPTPEHYTSKTCVKCMGACGPHPTLRTKKGKEIRGLRVCQHEGCGLLQNRDKTGATNIGLQFQRLLDGKSPIRDMSKEELEFHRLNTCLECCD